MIERLLSSPVQREHWYTPICAWGIRHVPFAVPVILACRRIWQSICDRLAEWMLTAIVIALGLAFYQPGDTFGLPSYVVLRTWASEDTWAVGLLAFGLARLIVLGINGAWRKSPHVRVGASAATIILWGALSYGYYQADVHSPGSLIFPVCIFGEIVSIYRALREAGHNDGKAPHQGNRG